MEAPTAFHGSALRFFLQPEKRQSPAEHGAKENGVRPERRERQGDKSQAARNERRHVHGGHRLAGRHIQRDQPVINVILPGFVDRDFPLQPRVHDERGVEDGDAEKQYWDEPG